MPRLLHGHFRFSSIAIVPILTTATLKNMASESPAETIFRTFSSQLVFCAKTAASCEKQQSCRAQAQSTRGRNGVSCVPQHLVLETQHAWKYEHDYLAEIAMLE